MDPFWSIWGALIAIGLGISVAALVIGNDREFWNDRD